MTTWAARIGRATLHRSARSSTPLTTWRWRSCRGRVGLSEFDAKTVLDLRVRKLADSIETVPTDDPYCFGPQEITVRLRNGKTLTRNVAVMKGHPDNPMSRAEQLAKAEECFAVGGAPESSVEKLVAWVDNLERNPSPVRSLVDLMASPNLVMS